MSASHELLSIADSLTVYSHSQDVVSIRQEELAGLAFALRDLSARVGHLEARSEGGVRGRIATRGPVPKNGAEVIPFPASSAGQDHREDTAA